MTQYMKRDNLKFKELNDQLELTQTPEDGFCGQSDVNLARLIFSNTKHLLDIDPARLSEEELIHLIASTLRQYRTY